VFLQANGDAPWPCRQMNVHSGNIDSLDNGYVGAAIKHWPDGRNINRSDGS
jgi:hypothetical protein